MLILPLQYDCFANPFGNIEAVAAFVGEGFEIAAELPRPRTSTRAKTYP